MIMVQPLMPPDILELLDDMEFPASKIEIIDHAQDHDPGEDALMLLEAIPDRIYDDLHDLNRGLGLIEDLPHTDDGWWPGAESANIDIPDNETRDIAEKLK